LADIVENLTPKSSVTLSAGYGLVHFYGGLRPTPGVPVQISFIGSREETAQIGYDRLLNPKDQVAVTYGYQGFDFSIAGTAFHSNVVQAMYGHRVSGRMDLTLGAGPQFTHIDANALECAIGNQLLPGQLLTQCPVPPFTIVTLHQKANHIGLAGSISLRYRFPKTTVVLGYRRFNTSGNGVFAGSRSDIVHGDVRRKLSRVWDLFADFGYSKNSRLQIGGSTVNANQFTDGFGGAGLHRQFGRSLRGFISYQYNYLTFDTSCPVPSTSTAPQVCSNHSQRHVGSIGLDWTPRPIRLD
jgi:hypothetical protein